MLGNHSVAQSREQVAKLTLYEIRIHTTVNGMKWPRFDPVKGHTGKYHIVGGTKNSTHLVPEGGSMWDKISINKKKMKILKRCEK